MMLPVVSVPDVLNTLIARTSGPFGNVPLPPSVVLVNSLMNVRSNVDLSPGFAMNEKIVSPGCAYGGAVKLNVMLVVPAVIVDELVV